MWCCDKLIKCFENIKMVNVTFNLITIAMKLIDFISC